MDESNKLMKMVIDYLTSFKQEIFKRFDNVDSRFDKVDKRMDQLEEKVGTVEKNVMKRVDRLGKQIAFVAG